ncbi:MAG: ATP-binding domain-containing protein, partial [Clostridia bacterium]|nr:ATP-binding domain-containing protein [Clostridia bacterium]
QNIYSWRGAEIKNILGFPKDFEGAKVYKLEQNYRSATGILDAANNVIKNNVARNKKNLWSEFKDDHCNEYFEAYSDRDEATYVSRQINWLVSSGREYRDIAILVRANSLTRLFEEDFNLHGIPYKVFGGFRFFERKEIKDTLAYVRLALNPSDNDSLLRIINYPSRGIGAKSVEELKQVATDNNMTLFSVLINPGFLNPNTAKKLAPFLSIAMDIIDKCKKLPPVEFIQYVIRRSGIEDNLLQAKEDDDAVKLENVHQLVSAVENFVKDNKGQEIVDMFGDTKVLNPTISDFMQSVALVSDSDDMDGDNYVTIATVHAVKGLEFDTVFIIGLEEGIFPVNRALQSGDIEEERRLMYVAITRAKRKLYATNVRQRFRFGEYVYAPKSRFITEMQGAKLSIRTTAPIQQQQSYATAKFGYSAPKAVQSSVYGFENNSIGFNKNAVVGASRPITKTSSNVDYSAFKANITVEHKKFGRGLIVSVEGEGENKTATIMFRQLGIKRFSLSIAAPHLTIVQE